MEALLPIIEWFQLEFTSDDITASGSKFASNNRAILIERNTFDDAAALEAEFSSNDGPASIKNCFRREMDQF